MVPSPDSMRLAVPKAFIALSAGHMPCEEVARSIFDYVLRDMRDSEGGFYSAEDADSVISPEHRAFLLRQKAESGAAAGSDAP